MNKIFGKIIICSMVTCCLPFMACGEDDPVSSGTEVAGDLNHVNIIPAQVEGNIEIKEDGIVELDAEDEMVLFPVACDVPVTEDTEISLKIKPIVVDLYNLYHDTNYKQFKQVEILTPKVTIRKGEQLSAEKIRLRITDMSGLYDGLGNHVVPIAFDSLPETFAEGERAEVLLNFRKKFQPNTIKVTNDIPEFGLSYTEGQLDNLKEEITLNNVLQAEKTAQDDIHITLAIDESLVAGYNEQNGTTYLPFPNAALKTENVILAMGSNMANVELKFADKMSAVEYGKKYLIPVVIKEVSGGGAVLGEEQVVYVRFSGETMFGVEVKDQTVGTQITAYDTWDVTVGGETEIFGLPWSYMLFSGWGSERVDAGKEIIVDMKEPTVITSVLWKSYSEYTFTQMTVGVSTDGKTYQERTIKIDAPAKIERFVFSSPVEARYIRFVSEEHTYPAKLEVYH